MRVLGLEDILPAFLEGDVGIDLLVVVDPRSLRHNGD